MLDRRNLIRHFDFSQVTSLEVAHLIDGRLSFPPLGTRYDVVFCPDVPNPLFKDTLTQATDLLAPGGVVIVGLENGLGIQHWNGKSNVFEGVLTDGLLSKNQLESIASESGFEKTDFYYPYPSHRSFCRVVTRSFFDEGTQPPWDTLRFEGRFFPEGLALDRLSKTGLFKEFSPSFFLVCSTRGTSAIRKQLLRPTLENSECGWDYSDSVLNGIFHSRGGKVERVDFPIENPAPSQRVEGTRVIHLLAQQAFLKDWGAFQKELLAYFKWSLENWKEGVSEQLSPRAFGATLDKAVKFQGHYHFDFLPWEVTERLSPSWFVLHNICSLSSLDDWLALGWYLRSPFELYEYLCVSLEIKANFERDIEVEHRFRMLEGKEKEAFVAHFKKRFPNIKREIDTISSLSLSSLLAKENERLTRLAVKKERNRFQTLFHSKVGQYLAVHRTKKIAETMPSRYECEFDCALSGYALAKVQGTFRKGDRVSFCVSFSYQGTDHSYETKEIPLSNKNTFTQILWIEGQVTSLSLRFSGSANIPQNASLRFLKKVEAHPRRLRKALPELMERAGGFSLFRKGLLESFRKGGLSAVKERLKSWGFEGSFRTGLYNTWVRQYDILSPADEAGIRERISRLKYKPKISIVMPTYNISEKFLRKAIGSVEQQIYPHWELCIADDASTDPRVTEVLDEYAGKDSRIKVVRREKNGHIAVASNSALELATGEFTGLLDHDDELSPHALYMNVEALNDNHSLDLLYSDEDKIDVEGNRSEAHFKPDFNSELFSCYNLITHFAVMRTELMRKVGGFAEGTEGSQDYDLFLRIVENTSREKIHHIPHVLYHWRILPGSTARGPAEKPYAHEAARKALKKHFDRRGISVTVTPGKDYSNHRVIYELPPKLPQVTAIICTRNRGNLLKNVVEGLRHQTDYASIETIIVDNKSNEPETLRYLSDLEVAGHARVLKYPAPFNYSEMNNLAAGVAKGDVLLFLNNDLKMIRADWLTEMIRFVLRPQVGVVGAKLLYPNDRVQHAGVVLGIGGVAGHIFHGQTKDEYGYFCRAQTPQLLSAVTGACLAIRKEVFEGVGGFDGFSLPVAFNDVDLCLKVKKAGFDVVINPYAVLYHLESASRGSDETGENLVRFRTDCHVMQSRWGSALSNDPYYNPNLSLGLTGNLFHCAFPPRAIKPWLKKGESERGEGNVDNKEQLSVESSKLVPYETARPS